MESASITINSTLSGFNEDGKLGISKLAETAIVSFIIAVGLALNSIAMYAILANGKLKQLGTQNVLVLHLCINHIIFLLNSIDSVIRILMVPLYPYIFCKLRGFLMYITVSNSITTLLLISLNRFFVVVFPTKKTIGFSTVRRTLLIILIVLLMNVCIFMMPLLGLWGQTGYDDIVQICTIIKHLSTSFNQFSSLLYIVLPLCIDFYCYAHVFVVLRRQQRKIQHKSFKERQSFKSGKEQEDSSAIATVSGRVGSTSADTDGKQKTLSNNSKPKVNAASKRHIALSFICFSLVVTHTLCYLPYLISTILQWEGSQFHSISATLTYLHAVLNPLIYLLGDKRLRTVICKK